MSWLLQGARPYLALLLLGLTLYLPGLSALPAMDRDESRFVQATRQMIDSGDYVTIWFQDQPRTKKPVGIHWLQAAAVQTVGGGDTFAVWAYRLPSVLGALAAVLLLFHYGRGLVGPPTALIGAGVLAASLMLVAEAHQAKTDAVLLACVVAAQGALGRFYLQSKGGRKAGEADALVFWLAQGIGILVKGPVVPVVSLLTVLALGVADRRFGWLRAIRPILGLIIVAAVVGPWVAAVSSATGGTFIGQSVKTDLLPKLLGVQEQHGGWPGTYLLLVTATFWPGSLFLWPALVAAWRKREAGSLRFLLAWAGPAWIMFELLPTKLPHYVLPLYPALALLVGWAVAAGVETLQARAARWWYLAWALLGVVLAALALVLPLLYGDGPGLWSLVAAPAAMAAALVPMIRARFGEHPRALAGAVALAVCVYAAVFHGVLPSLEKLWLSPRLAAAVAQHQNRWPLASAGYSEPSLVVALGTPTILTDAAGAARHLAEHPGALAAVEAREQPKFLEALAGLGSTARLVDTIEGFNYSRGKPATLHLYASGAAAVTAPR